MNPASWAEDLLELLLPAGCVACRAWIPPARPTPLVCVGCRSRLREAPWPRCPRCHHPRGTGRVDGPDCLECRAWDPALSLARYAFVLEPPADDLVHALKYENWPELADLMGSAMARLPLPAGDDRPGAGDARSRWADVPSRTADVAGRVVVPVPTTAERLAVRGYNQAELLARRLASGLGTPVCPALRRSGGRPSQTSLAPEARRENVRGVFTPAPGRAPVLEGKDVLLVDDVLTTGATASEAARTLVASGARRVALVAFARALPTRPGRSG